MHEGTGAHLYPIHVHNVAVCWFRLGLSKWERLLLILSDFIHSKVISQPTHGCMCVCVHMCVILPGVNKKRNLFTLAPYVNKTCRPNPVYCEYPIYLSSIPSPSSLPCSPFLYPSLSPTNSPLIQPPLLFIHTHNSAFASPPLHLKLRRQGHLWAKCGPPQPSGFG